jgi:hypothetical protein
MTQALYAHMNNKRKKIDAQGEKKGLIQSEHSNYDGANLLSPLPNLIFICVLINKKIIK